jgi:hypothetical protein
MACTPTLTDITYSCDDLALGGVTELYVGNKADLLSLIAVDASDVVTITPAATNLLGDDDVVKIEFNIKDGFSSFADVKTVADGSLTVVPTITVEIPKMTAAHRNAVEQMSDPSAQLVAFVATAAGTYHLVGWEYGLFVSTVDGASGVNRGDKNRYQLTLTGEQSKLAFDITTAEWADVA